VTLPYWVPARALGLGASTAPSNRIRMAAIGLGFGWQMFVRDDVQYVAVCDVQQQRREAAKAYVEAGRAVGPARPATISARSWPARMSTRS